MVRFLILQVLFIDLSKIKNQPHCLPFDQALKGRHSISYSDLSPDARGWNGYCEIEMYHPSSTVSRIGSISNYTAVRIEKLPIRSAGG
jgi:hypothetical protein